MEVEIFELLRFLFRSKHDLLARSYISDEPFFLEDTGQSGKGLFKGVCHSVERLWSHFLKDLNFSRNYDSYFLAKNKCLWVITISNNYLKIIFIRSSPYIFYVLFYNNTRNKHVFFFSIFDLRLCSLCFFKKK